MRIVEQSEHTMRLRGVPGGAGWMAAFAAFGLLVIGVCIAIVATGSVGGWSIVGPAAGVAFGLLFVWVGAQQLLKRESLTLDRRLRRGAHGVRHLFASTGKLAEFTLDDVAEVALSTTIEDADPGDRSNAATTAVWRAELRLASPRPAILLAESQNDREAPVREVAEAVARFLDRSLSEEFDGDAETIDAADVGRPIADRAGPIDLPPAPEGSRIDVRIDPEGQRVTLSWKSAANGCLVVPFIAVFLLWTLASIAMTLGALGVLPPSASPTPWAAAVAIVFALFGLAMLGYLIHLLVRARRTVTFTPGSMRIDAPNRLWISQRIPTGDITSVRMSDRDDAVHISAGKRRARLGVHLPADGEVKWLAASIRAILKSMR